MEPPQLPPARGKPSLLTPLKPSGPPADDRLVGVKDVANLRLSLPASLLEPVPNLEYWQYADRADIFAA